MRYIYQLKDPISKAIRYIGQTGDVEKRLHWHCYQTTTRHPKKGEWILFLRALGLKPVIEIIDTCEDEKAIELENKYIISAINKGCDLFNLNNKKTWKQYDLNGNFINEFATVGIVYEMTGFKPNKRDRKLHNYSWYYDNLGTGKRQPYKRHKTRVKKVIQVDSCGKLIEEYDSVRDAGRAIGVDHKTISYAAKTPNKELAGCYWKFKE